MYSVLFESSVRNRFINNLCLVDQCSISVIFCELNGNSIFVITELDGLNKHNWSAVSRHLSLLFYIIIQRTFEYQLIRANDSLSQTIRLHFSPAIKIESKQQASKSFNPA